MKRLHQGSKLSIHKRATACGVEFRDRGRKVGISRDKARGNPNRLLAAVQGFAANRNWPSAVKRKPMTTKCASFDDMAGGDFLSVLQGDGRRLDGECN